MNPISQDLFHQHFCWQDWCGQKALARAHEWGTSGQKGECFRIEDPSTPLRMSLFGHKILCGRPELLQTRKKRAIQSSNFDSRAQQMKYDEVETAKTTDGRCGVQQTCWPVLFLFCKTHTHTLKCMFKHGLNGLVLKCEQILNLHSLYNGQI